MEIEAIHSQFQKSLLRYLKSKIKSKEDAEDILQNVFIKITSNVNKLSDKEKLRNWIYAVTRNAIIDYYRTRASKKNAVFDESISDRIIDEDEIDSTQGLDQCLQGMIDQLPDEYKDIIIDSELKEIKQKDLAKKYNLPYPTLRARVQRGRERLKQLLYSCCKIETDTRGNILTVETKNNCVDPCKSSSE